MDYDTYIAEFNKGNDAALVERFFAKDVHFQSGPRVLEGTKELLDFLQWAHDGIREIIRAQHVMNQGKHIFAEIDMDFHATRDRPDFVFGALKKGEATTVKFLVLYRLGDDDKIVQFKSATWPPKVGVTPAAPLP
jgi:hypothetical protein